MNRHSLARLKLICPTIAYHVGRLDSTLQSRYKIYIEVVQGLRSWQYQQELYDRGRILPGKIVTNCRPGHSWHNFGMAIDVCPDKYFEVPGFQPNWDDKHPDWIKIANTGQELGFLPGALFRSFPDKPHLQITGKFPVSPTDEIRLIFREAGMEELWRRSGIYQ